MLFHAVGVSRISTHAPTEGSDPLPHRDGAGNDISTHAPTEGSDNPGQWHYIPFLLFQPTLPPKGATSTRRTWRRNRRFQPTLPPKGATMSFQLFNSVSAFQPTLPPKGATFVSHCSTPTHLFQPTLPPKGATRSCLQSSCSCLYFNPRSHRRERRP